MAIQKPPWAQCLRQLRTVRGWTQHSLSVRILDVMRRHGMPAPTMESLISMVKRWERGGTVPDETYQYCLATVYGQSVPAVFGQHAKLNALPARSHAMSGSLDLPHLARAEGNPMQRRLFVAWLMRVSVGATMLPESVKHLISLIDDDPDILPAITMHDVAKLNAVHETFNQLSLGVGAMARKAAVAQLSFATDQLRAGVPGDPEALNAWRILTARLSDTASAMSLDAGRVPQAQTFSALCVEITATMRPQPTADAATGFFMAKLAQRLVETGQPRTALDVVDQAQAIARGASPTTVHATHAVKAEVLGALGDGRGVQRELGLAEEAFTGATPDDLDREPWAWLYQKADRYEFHGGHSRLRLAQANPDQLTPDLTTATCDALAAHRDGSGMGELWEARAHLYSATALMLGREPEEAVRVCRQALPLLPPLRSRRVDDDVRDLMQASRPHLRRSDVKDLMAELDDNL